MSENKKTIFFAVLSIILAVIVGCVFGDSVRVMLGTNEDSALMSDFSDRLSVIKAVFAEQSEPYMTAAFYLFEDEGLELMASKSGAVYVRTPEGELIPASDYYAGTPEMLDALDEIFFTEPESVELATDTNGEEITDVMLYNIKVKDKQVSFILYYCPGGYIGIVYDNEDRIDTNMNIIRLSESDGQSFGWGIVTRLDS